MNNGIYKIEFLEKDTPVTLNIEKENIDSAIIWKRGRPRIMILSIYDKTEIVAVFYSGGKKKIELELEDINFKIQQKRSNGNFTN
jgi:hypothetical protein